FAGAASLVSEAGLRFIAAQSTTSLGAVGRGALTALLAPPDRCRFAPNCSRGSCAARIPSRIVTVVTYAEEVRMSQQADERVMISERLAPGMLPRVLN